jgi:hypothetical protein
MDWRQQVMDSILELAAAVGAVLTVLIEEVVNSIIRRAAKNAGTSSTIIRNVGVIFPVV